MSCTDDIFRNISNCDLHPRGGFEDVAWLMNHYDAVFTFGGYDNLITAITLATGFSYTVTTVKKEMNGGFGLEPSDFGDMFHHQYQISPYQRDAESIENIDDANGLLVIAELKGSKTEGCFVAYGVDVGMYKSNASQDVNSDSGLPTYGFNTPGDLGERYSRFVIWDTDYETTKEMIENMAMVSHLLKEDGFNLLLETGGKIILE